MFGIIGKLTGIIQMTVQAVFILAVAVQNGLDCHCVRYPRLRV